MVSNINWYGERAADIARYMSNEPPMLEAATAVMQELALDGGRRSLLLDSVFVIIHGSPFCKDNDEIKGYIVSEEQAKKTVKHLNSVNGGAQSYFYEEVKPIILP